MTFSIPADDIDFRISTKLQSLSAPCRISKVASVTNDRADNHHQREIKKRRLSENPVAFYSVRIELG